MVKEENVKKRSIRRHFKEKMKRRTKMILKRWGMKDPTDPIVGKHCDNLTKCSCYMCGNPRRLHKDKLTRQEIEAELEEKEWKIEIDGIEDFYIYLVEHIQDLEEDLDRKVDENFWELI